MRDFMRLFAGDSKMVRDYAVMSLGIIAGTLICAHGLATLVASGDQSEPQKLSSVGARENVRTYTVTRSVLDDPITTGSLGKIHLDPCKK